jgi:hypothetical protein
MLSTGAVWLGFGDESNYINDVRIPAGALQKQIRLLFEPPR